MSEGIIDILQRELAVENLEKLSRELDGIPVAQIKVAASGIVTMLTVTCAGKASDPKSAGWLNEILESKQLSDEDASGIGAILLGDKQSDFFATMGQMSGLDTARGRTLTNILTPRLLNAIGQVKREQQLDATKLAELLKKGRESNTEIAQFLKMMDAFFGIEQTSDPEDTKGFAAFKDRDLKDNP
ncbi:MAG: DUF937 domain-containing protein [Saprospiraceae bacterium]|nr:hypothetical protein [Lewinella sp.]